MRRLVALSMFAAPVLLAPLPAGAYTVQTIQVTTGPSNQFDPAVSNGKVAWTDAGDPLAPGNNSDIWVYDIATQSYTQLLSVGGGSDTANQQLADINGSTVVYTDDRNGAADIYSFDLMTGFDTHISHGAGNELHPAISSTGRIVWESDDLTVYSLDPANFAETRIDDNGAVIQQHAAISGSIAVWHELGAAGVFRIRMHDFNANTTADVTTNTTFQCQNPDIDGAWVVYQCDNGGATHIYARNLVSNVETQLTTVGVQANAKVSGNYVVWEDLSKAGDSDLYGVDLTDPALTVTALATTTANEHLHDISGFDVAYTTDAAGNDDIVVLHVTVTAPPPTSDPCDPASGAPLLFEETFAREKGKPKTETRTFTAPTGMINGTICLDLDRVSSAKVGLNGEPVFVQSDFNATLTSLQKDVTLTDSNTLEVTLYGKPHHGETHVSEPNHHHGHGHWMRGEHGGGHDGDDDDHDGDGDDDHHGDGDCGHQGGDDGPTEHPAGGAVMHLRVVGPTPAPAACSVASASAAPSAGAMVALLFAGFAVALPRTRRLR